jgi:hypothetical protein
MIQSKAVNSILITVLCTAASTIYGVLHDQVTVRICREYFTVFHPLIFGAQPDTILALLWGAVATWWVGAFLGILMAIAACFGKEQMVQAESLILPVLKLLCIMAISATLAGLAGYLSIDTKVTVLAEKYAHLLKPEMYARFSADACAHNTSYLVGLFGGSVMVIDIWKSRHRKSKT